MSSLERVKREIGSLSEGERWELREWLDGHTVDLDATSELRELLRIATETLGDDYTARRWLQSPIRSLGEEVPAIVARRSRAGFVEVRDLLGRIASGDTFL